MYFSRSLAAALCILASLAVFSNSECQDSPLKFRAVVKGKEVLQNCDFVAKDPDKRCITKDGGDKKKRQSHCPIACNSTDLTETDVSQYCFEDSKEKFQLVSGRGKKNKKRWKGCNWVGVEIGTNITKVEKRCGFDGVKETCRATCQNFYNQVLDDDSDFFNTYCEARDFRLVAFAWNVYINFINLIQ